MNLTVAFILNHLPGSRRRLMSIARWAGWQFKSRPSEDVIVNWIGGLKPAARSGVTGISGNIYVGLHEFVDMAFALHFLDERDVFLDIGANVGSYALLATGLRKAKTVAFEPDPEVFKRLKRNIDLNSLSIGIVAHQVALGSEAGQADLTVGLDTVNHIVADGAAGASRTVTMQRLDDSVSVHPALIKVDVEGFGHEATRGGAEVLASASLHALLVETVTDETAAMLKGAGFFRVYYDPFKRALLHESAGLCESNQFFVRGRALVEARLRRGQVIDVWGEKV